MLAALPFLSFCILVFGFRKRGCGLRESLLFGTIPCGLFIVLTTEGLSVLHAISRWSVALVWLCFALASVWWARRAVLSEDKTLFSCRSFLKGLDLSSKLGLLGVAAIAALIALTAWASAPNTWDSMEYHMPRIVEWAGNRGVQLYPTIDRQQLSMPPFFEYGVLHLYLLYGSDRLANFIQFFSFLGCIIAVSLIVQWLGGDRRAQVFAAVLTATIPSGILGASGVKNDVVLSFWIAFTVYLLLRWKTRRDWWHLLAIASTVSLAVFTKGTAYAFLPFLFVACAATWDGAGIRRFLLHAPLVVVPLFVLVNGPLWARNYRFSGSILGLPYFDGAGPNSARTFANAHITLTRSLANVLRSIALNLGVPNAHINVFTTGVVSHAIRMLGVDPNDPTQIVIGQSGIFRPFEVAFAWRNEALTGNSAHLFLWVLAGLCGMFAFRRVGREVWLLGLGAFGALCLFAALLRWSPFNARYELPAFVIASAFVALVLSRVAPKMLVPVAMVLLLLLSLPPAFANQSRPLLTGSGLKGSILTTPRDQTYFFDEHQDISQSFISAAKATAASGCKNIGVDANLLHYEYPMFALLEEYERPQRILYVGVTNPTKNFQPNPAQTPCAVVCLGCAHSVSKLAQYSSSGQEAKSFGYVVIFVPVETPAGTAKMTPNAGAGK